MPTRIPPSTAPRNPRADLIRDGLIDIRDLSRLISKWASDDAEADVNQDGRVSVVDLSIVISNWGRRFDMTASATVAQARLARAAAAPTGAVPTTSRILQFGPSAESLGVLPNGAVIGNAVAGSEWTSVVQWRSQIGEQLLMPGISDAAVFDVSRSGWIVGTGRRDGLEVGWYRTPGGRVGLLDSGGNKAGALGVDESGRISGFVHDGTSHAVVWDQPTGRARTLSGSGSDASSALEINDAGQVVGDRGSVVTLWSSSGVPLGSWPGSATDLNSKGEVLLRLPQSSGRRPAIARGGAVTQLPGIGGFNGSIVATSLTDTGIITGSIGSLPVLWSPDGPAKALSLPRNSIAGRALRFDRGTAYGWVLQANGVRKAHTWSTVTDKTPPQTTVRGPVGRLPAGRVSFRFLSDETASTFRCRWDAAQWAPCTSPTQRRITSIGEHSFAVRAIDRSGNVDPTPAVRDFSIVRSPRKLVVKATAAKSRTILLIDIAPNWRNGNYRLTVQRKSGRTWKSVARRRTVGRADSLRLDLPKGTYRVVAPAQNGRAKSTSAPVRIRR